MIRLTSSILAAVVLVLAGCVPGPSNPESAAVSRLSQQGFKLVSDGRRSDRPTAMQYAGAAERVLACNGPQSKSLTTQDGLKATQSGSVQAYVIIDNNGGRRGLYTNALLSEVRAPSGALVARQIENIRFAPTAQGRFRSGLTCKPRA